MFRIVLEPVLQYNFIQFDIDNFYSSVSEKLLKDTVNWASTLTEIPEKTREIIFQVRNTFLFHRGQTYNKKINPNCNVAMGSFDSAEITNLVGLYILSLLSHLPVVVGLYRDDGAVLSRLNPHETENVKKEICRIICTGAILSYFALFPNHHRKFCVEPLPATQGSWLVPLEPPKSPKWGPF